MLKTIADNRLITSGDQVLVALSGGPDSVALVHLLAGQRKRLGMTLHALYINHLIREKAAVREERFCHKLCDSLGIPLTIERVDVPALAKKERIGLEEAGRIARYQLFERIARKERCNRVALAHHADDRVETILFHLFRGTGPAGLVGMLVQRGNIIRPFYDITKAEILAYLKRHRRTYCVDQSNADARFRRNYIRNRLLPLLRKEVNGSVDAAILRLAAILTEENRLLDTLTAKAVKAIVRKTPGGKFQLALTAYGKYDLAVRRRLLRHCLERLTGSGMSADWVTVERLDTFATSGRTGTISLTGKLQAAKHAGQLLLYRRGKRTFSHEIELPGVTQLPELGAAVRIFRTAKKQRFTAGQRWTGEIIDAATLHSPLSIRSIRPGDRFRPLGMSGTKKVGDYLTDKKIAAALRDEIPLVCDREGIIWIPGLVIADRVKVTASTKQMLKLAYRIDGKTA